MSHTMMMEDDDILDFGEFSDSDEVFEPNQVDIAELEKELGITSIGETTNHSSASELATNNQSSASELATMDPSGGPNKETMVNSTPTKSCDTTSPPVPAPCTNNRSTSLSSTKSPYTAPLPTLSSDEAAVASITVSPPSATSNSVTSTNKKSFTKIKRTRQKRIRHNDSIQQKQPSKQKHQPSEQHQHTKQQKHTKKQNQPKKQQQTPRQPQQKAKTTQHALTKPGDSPLSLSGQIHNTIKKSGLPLPGNDDRLIHIQRTSTGVKRTIQASSMQNKRRRQDDDTTWEASHLITRRRRLESDRQGTNRGISIRGAALSNLPRRPLPQPNHRPFSNPPSRPLPQTYQPPSSNPPGPLPQTNTRPFSILGAATRDNFSFVNRASAPISFRPSPDAISFVNRRPKPFTQAPVLQRLGDGSARQQPARAKSAFVGGRQISVNALKY